MPVSIRPAEPDDLPGALAAYAWLFAPPGAQPPTWDEREAADALAELVASPDGEALVAVQDGAVVGLCTVYRDIRSVRYGRRAWVEDLAVDPQQRSAGIGKGLLDAAKAWAVAAGATHLELDSSTTREDAHRFYERERPTWRSLCFGWLLSG